MAGYISRVFRLISKILFLEDKVSLPRHEIHVRHCIIGNLCQLKPKLVIIFNSFYVLNYVSHI